MPVEIADRGVFSEAKNDWMERCDCCVIPKQLIREVATDGVIARNRRRCPSTGVVYWRPQGEGGLIVAGLETMRRAAVRVYQGAER